MTAQTLARLPAKLPGTPPTRRFQLLFLSVLFLALIILDKWMIGGGWVGGGGGGSDLSYMLYRADVREDVEHVRICPGSEPFPF